MFEASYLSLGLSLLVSLLDAFAFECYIAPFSSELIDAPSLLIASTFFLIAIKML